MLILFNLFSTVAPTAWIVFAGILGIAIGAYYPKLLTIFKNDRFARLQVLAEPHRVLPPAGQDGNGLPPSRITPYSGIYDENGKLPTPASNLTFLAHA